MGSAERPVVLVMKMGRILDLESRFTRSRPRVNDRSTVEAAAREGFLIGG